METLIVICLLAVLSPICVGIAICLWKFFCEKCSKIQKYFVLRKEEKQMRKNLTKYSDWYSNEQIATIKACILNDRWERINLFSIEDIKIWKAFI